MIINFQKDITKLATTIFGLLAFLILIWWISFDPTEELIAHHPGMDNQPTKGSSASELEKIEIGSYFQKFASLDVELPGEWIQFRGADSKNIIESATKLADQWPATGPEILWSVNLGEGHAAPSIKNGRVYLIDYDEDRGMDLLRCFPLSTGKELWQRGYPINIKRNHGMSRTIPALTDDYVVTIGPKCHTMCVDAKTGDFLWGIDMEEKYGTETPFWYTGQCPIIDDSLAILAPVGSALLIGVSLKTGQVKWSTPNPNNWQMSHTSVMPTTFANKKMYIYSAIGGMVAVSADSASIGEVLWETKLWSHSVLAPSPLITDDGKIYLTAGYGAGGMLLQMKEDNGKISVTKLQEFLPKDGMACEQQTALDYKGHFFTIHPKDAGELRQQFACYKSDDCTNPIFSSGSKNRYGLGPFIIADDKFYILNDDGTLTMARASTTKFEILGQAKVLDGHDAWGPFAIVGNRMLLRDSKRLICINIGD